MYLIKINKIHRYGTIHVIMSLVDEALDSTIKYFSVSYIDERPHLRIYKDPSMKDVIL